MILKVEEYAARDLCHVCRDLAGNKLRVDLFVDGPFEGANSLCPEKLVGKTVSIESLSPYISIGMGVKIEEAA